MEGGGLSICRRNSLLLGIQCLHVFVGTDHLLESMVGYVEEYMFGDRCWGNKLLGGCGWLIVLIVVILVLLI